jgi:hypothetical protein
MIMSALCFAPSPLTSLPEGEGRSLFVRLPPTSRSGLFHCGASRLSERQVGDLPHIVVAEPLGKWRCLLLTAHRLLLTAHVYAACFAASSSSAAFAFAANAACAAASRATGTR